MRQQVHVLFSHVHAMLRGDVVQTQCCLWRSCPRSSPALNYFSDVFYDWAGGAGAELVTTEVSQLNCSHNAQAFIVCMLLFTSVFHFGMRMRVNDVSCQSVM